jgi:hypothetical protein
MVVMNLRRGLLRLWVVFSIAWIVAVGYHGYTSHVWFRPVPVEENEPLPAPASEPVEKVELFGLTYTRDIIESHVRWAFGVPIGCYPGVGLKSERASLNGCFPMQIDRDRYPFRRASKC